MPVSVFRGWIRGADDDATVDNRFKKMVGIACIGASLGACIGAGVCELVVAPARPFSPIHPGVHVACAIVGAASGAAAAVTSKAMLDGDPVVGAYIGGFVGGVVGGAVGAGITALVVPDPAAIYCGACAGANIGAIAGAAAGVAVCSGLAT
ncbi:hypothetical protein EVJ58_g10706 [Rhodofomes roseus]|uniref:Uncharacterized protein n=1 Tax=Rhodofomes roseus TaxID=34475 RepID=A0A4Y9XPM6_9APHY|nr:hypothetical protein EVJ58_g10706 [Rhodofomes roseus]